MKKLKKRKWSMNRPINFWVEAHSVINFKGTVRQLSAIGIVRQKIAVLSNPFGKKLDCKEILTGIHRKGTVFIKIVRGIHARSSAWNLPGNKGKFNAFSSWPFVTTSKDQKTSFFFRLGRNWKPALCFLIRPRTG